MPGKWDWLKDEIKASNFLTGGKMILKFLTGKISSDDLTKCALCPNMCRHACPVSIVDGRETTSPAGKARIALMIEKGFLELEEENLRPLYFCLSCDLCSEYCPFEFSVSDLIRGVKERGIEEGIVLGELEEVFQNLRRARDVYGKEDSEERGKGRVLYFRGCTIRDVLPELGDKAFSLLKRLKYDVFKIKESCCGIPAYNLGNIKLFKEIAEETAKRINESGAEMVITSCPSCAYAFRSLYPKYGIKVRPRVLHITEAIKERGFSARSNSEVTYHVPCKLGISLKEKEILLEILEKIEGLRIKTPRREVFCCGRGGSAIPRISKSLSEKISKERRSQLIEASKKVITACPSCKLSLEGDGLEVLDIAEFLHDLLGEEDEP